MSQVETWERLLALARDAASRAYAPYSGFPVGAAVLSADGRVFLGANIENASTSLGCCAERVAVFHAVMEGVTEIAAVAVWAPKATPCPPCGACRQVLVEWRPAASDTTIVLEGESGPMVTTLGELIPLSFGPRKLEIAGGTA